MGETLTQQRRVIEEGLRVVKIFNPAYIGQLERGVKNASLYTLEKIACALELSLTDLVGNSDIVTETAKTNIPADCRSIICMYQI